jgi:hypothetical protein
MAEPPKPLNRAAIAGPAYPQPVLGNPASTLMESGVGNCYPGLEFDLRQLDVRFFPGLVFEFLGIEPAGPDGTQGVHLVYADVESDPLLAGDAPWIGALKKQLNGPAGAALSGGDWYLHSIEQHGRRIDLYDFNVFQNATLMTPYEGETCWWVIRGIEPDVDLTIALTQRDQTGQPSGSLVVLHGQRRRFLDAEGMIPDVYRPGELTASMCSPWTHDFRDCACQYWASNHPDVVLGPVTDPARLEDGTSPGDPAQSVTFRDWLRRRGPARDVSAPPTLEQARPDDYDPFEINLRWEELEFVLQGIETGGTPKGPQMVGLGTPYPTTADAIRDLSEELAPLEFTLSMVYLYACFSLRSPEEVTQDERKTWPELADDLRAARQFLLSVALSEMTHLRWVNQMLWMLDRAGLYPDGQHYEPVVHPLSPDAADPASGKSPGGLHRTVRMLRPATLDAIKDFIDVERPGDVLDREYAGLVEHLRSDPAAFPAGLYELAVRIDSDGLQHYQKFRDIHLILSRYNPALFLRPIKLADPGDPAVKTALSLLAEIVEATKQGYVAEHKDDMPQAEACLLRARAAMRSFQAEAEHLAGVKGLGIPFFAKL